MALQLMLAEEERRLLLELLDQEILDLHGEIHHGSTADCKAELRKRLEMAEMLRKEMHELIEVGAAWPT
jgi:hypothetical protein